MVRLASGGASTMAGGGLGGGRCRRRHRRRRSPPALLPNPDQAVKEAAAALDAVVLLGLAPAAEVEPVVALLGRVHAMLTRLARPAR